MTHDQTFEPSLFEPQSLLPPRVHLRPRSTLFRSGHIYACAGGLAMLQSPIEDLEVTMAKGQMRSNREKKKPK